MSKQDYSVDLQGSNCICHNSLSLKELLRAAEDLCFRLQVPFEMQHIKVSTDYGTKVVLSYEGPYKEIENASKKCNLS